MAREEDTGKTTKELIERAWQLVRKADSVVLITVGDEEIQARPMSPRLEGDARVIHFLTSATSRKVQLIESGRERATVFCAHGNGYVSFTGTLMVSEDRAKMKALWSPFDRAWWDSPEDPSLRLVTFQPTTAELWDKPSALTSAALLLVATVAGSTPKLGDHAARLPPVDR